MRFLKIAGLLTLLSVAAIAAACSGEDGGPGASGVPGSPGAGGTTGPVGSQGPPGSGSSSGGADASANLVFLTERAQKGITIAPVPLSLGGKTNAQLEQIGIGSYLVNAAADCDSCHSTPGKYLAGGIVFPIDATHTVVSRNITPDPATGLKDTEDQFLQAFRNGTDILNVSQGLILHPWQYERWMSTSDIRAIYAYLKVIPAVANTYAADNKPPIPGVAFPNTYNEGDKDRLLPAEVDFADASIPDPDSVLRGLAIVPVDVAPPTDPAQMALYGRGSYLVNAVIGCAACHSNPDRDYTSPTQKVLTATYMAGNRVIPADPSIAPLVKVVRSTSANLIGQTHGFFNEPTTTFAIFLETLMAGVHADEPGKPPLVYPMPSRIFRNLTLGDLEAMYTYFKHLATNKPVIGAKDLEARGPARYCAAVGDCIAADAETCNAVTHECEGRTCAVAEDCDTCQTCPGGTLKCTAPAPGSPCTLGL